MTREVSFDHVARTYRWAEYFSLGSLLQRTRVHHLPALMECRRALVLGDGDGRFLARLLRQNPDLQATAVDTSGTMLQLLRDRCAFAEDRLRITKKSALDVEAPEDTELVVTHFVLDCFTQTEIDSLAQRFADQLAPGTLWLVSDFAVPKTPLLRAAGRAYIRALYIAFGALTGLKVRNLPDPQAALAQAGFIRIARHEKLFGLVYTELWQNGRSEL